MTRDQLLNILRTHSTEIARSEFLDRCWLERPMFQRWLAKHNLPLSPSRFEPLKSEIKGEPLPQFKLSGETKIESPPQLEPREAEAAIGTPPRRQPGEKPRKRNAVRAYIDKLYPGAVLPPNVTHKTIANDFEHSEGGFHVSPRTVSRALGGK